jgi:hypothetical protein
MSRGIKPYRTLRHARDYRDYRFEDHICEFYLSIRLKYEPHAVKKIREYQIVASGRSVVRKFNALLVIPFRAKIIIDIFLYC